MAKNESHESQIPAMIKQSVETADTAYNNAQNTTTEEAQVKYEMAKIVKKEQEIIDSYSNHEQTNFISLEASFSLKDAAEISEMTSRVRKIVEYNIGLLDINNPTYNIGHNTGLLIQELLEKNEATFDSNNPEDMELLRVVFDEIYPEQDGDTLSDEELIHAFHGTPIFDKIQIMNHDTKITEDPNKKARESRISAHNQHNHVHRRIEKANDKNQTLPKKVDNALKARFAASKEEPIKTTSNNLKVNSTYLSADNHKISPPPKQTVLSKS